MNAKRAVRLLSVLGNYGDNCYLPGSFNRCFVGCSNFLTYMEYMIKYSGFSTHGQRQEVSTPTKIKTFCN